MLLEVSFIRSEKTSFMSHFFFTRNNTDSNISILNVLISVATTLHQFDKPTKINIKLIQFTHQCICNFQSDYLKW